MILFFDTETTGLIKDYSQPADATDNCPRIVQLGWALFTDEGKEIVKTSNIIKPDGWEIEPNAIETHGFTLDMCNEMGIPLKDALRPFIALHMWSDVTVAHNLNFDSKVIRSELIRIGSKYTSEQFKSKKSVCTMLETTKFCNIRNPKTKFKTCKWPKLHELYQRLFDKKMEYEHDALGDVMNTAACYFELKKIGVL